jgi:hypothetical protein
VALRLTDWLWMGGLVGARDGGGQFDSSLAILE